VGVIDEMIEIMEMSMEVVPEGKDEPESEEERLERALAVVKGDREASEELQETLAPFREEAYRFYRGRALGNERAGRSKVVSSDVMDAVEWVMPSLMRIYFSSDIVSCEPVGPEDQIVAERVSALLNYQFTRRGDGFVVAYKWFKDALIYGLGVAKISWEDRFRDVPFAVPEMSESDFNALSSENGVEITGFERVEIPPDEVSVQRVVQQTVMGLPPDMPDDEKAEAVRMAVESMPRLATYFNVEGKRAILDYSGPVYEVIPPEDFLYDPEAEELRDARFVIHRVFRTPDYLRRMESEGVYFNVEEAIEKGNTQRDGDRSDREKGFRNAENNRTNPWTMTENIEDADKRRPLELYEWWGLFDPDGSGRLTPHVITVANDVVIRLERNPYDHGEPPFEVLRPVLDVHKFEGIGFADMVKEFQETKTSLRRQILDNISWQNNGMWEVQRGAGVEMESLVNPRPGGVVRTDMPGAVRPLTPPPLQQAGFMALEFEQTQLEQRTGITRYNQGLDSRSLNKMLALDTLIPLIDGSVKLNKDIVEGDIVVGSNGKGTKVIKAHPVQVPERAFEIVFQTGDVIRSGGEHRWAVKVCGEKYQNMSPDWEKLPAERIFDLMQSGHHVYVPRVQSPDFTEKELPMDPYVFGAWLGDGNSHTNRFTTQDAEILDAFEKWAKGFYKGGVEKCSKQHSGKAITYQVVNTPFRKILKDLGCLKDSRYEDTKYNVKHIPEIYLRGSFEQRLALLRGLMDTDGHISKNGDSIFCSSEPALIESFVKLIETFGCKAGVNWRETCGHKFPNAKPAAHVVFATPFCPVTLPAKVARWRTREKFWEKQRIVSIREIPVEPMRCLSVEADDELYCCGQKMTVTANTATGITAIMGASQQRIELIARLFAETGVRNLFVKALSLNRQFVRDEFVVRLYGEPIVINKDDVSGQFDILVSVGISASKQEVVQQQMIQLIQMAPGLAQAQVMTPDNIYAIMVKLLEGWGFKDHSQLMTNPNVMGQMTQQMQQMQQQMQMMQMILQHPSIANVVPQIAQQVQQAQAQQAQAAPPAQGEQPPAQGPVPMQGGAPV